LTLIAAYRCQDNTKQSPEQMDWGHTARQGTAIA